MSKALAMTSLGLMALLAGCQNGDPERAPTLHGAVSMGVQSGHGSNITR